MSRPLSRIYLDGVPVPLPKDEAAPTLSRVARAVGKEPGEVERLASRNAARGHAMDAGERVDRTADPTHAIYLRSTHEDTVTAPQDPQDGPDLGPLDRDGMPVAFAPTLTWYAKQEEARSLAHARRGPDAPAPGPDPGLRAGRRSQDAAQDPWPRPRRGRGRTH